MPSPSNYEDICNRLRQDIDREKEEDDDGRDGGLAFPRKGFQRVNIYRGRRDRDELVRRCFNMTNGHYGWCGTCAENATEPGTKG